jgi:hypothetical protein
MVYAINVADIVEENGKTVRQNNNDKTHDIPIGALVEVKYDSWHGGGACEKVHARLWVASHDRDCDGTPLYSLSPHKKDMFEGAQIVFPHGFTHDSGPVTLKESISQNMLNNIKSGFARESLTPIEVTKQLDDGVDDLRW